jgi:hypothetical protein
MGNSVVAIYAMERGWHWHVVGLPPRYPVPHRLLLLRGSSTRAARPMHRLRLSGVVWAEVDHEDRAEGGAGGGRAWSVVFLQKRTARMQQRGVHYKASTLKDTPNGSSAVGSILGGGTASAESFHRDGPWRPRLPPIRVFKL